MRTSEALIQVNRNLLKRKEDKNSLESMTKTGLVPTGERPSFSHSSQ